MLTYSNGVEDRRAENNSRSGSLKGLCKCCWRLKMSITNELKPLDDLKFYS